MMTIKIEHVEDEHSRYKDNEIFKSSMLDYVEEITFLAICSYANANLAHFLHMQSIEKVSNCFIRWCRWLRAPSSKMRKLPGKVKIKREAK